MANDKTKIIIESGDLYVAPTGTNFEIDIDLANWTEVGWCEGGSIKLTVSGRNEIELHNDQKYKLSLDFVFEAIGLETTLQRVSELEALQTENVDFMLITERPYAGAFKGHRFNNFGLSIEPDFVFSSKTPRKLKIEGTRTAKNYSELHEVVNIT
jgi:hypothetical protein